MGIVGCFLGFVVMGLLTYKGWNIILSSLAGMLVVVVTNGLDLVESLTGLYLTGMGDFLAQYFGLFLFGAILAELYAASGAALSIALGISKGLVRETYSPEKRRAMVVLVIILFDAALVFGGVGASLAVMVAYPIALELFRVANIPKKYIIAAILGGCVGFAMGMPGSPQPANVIPMQILGTSSTAALVPGIIGAIAEIAMMVFLLTRMINRGIRRGERFEYGENDKEFAADEKRPPVWLAVIPMALLFILFNIVQWNIIICLAIACIASAIMFLPYFPNRNAKKPLGKGALNSLPATISICAVMGFSTVVQSTESFQIIVDSVLGLNMNPYLLLIVVVAFMCMLCGGSATGQAIAIPIVEPKLVALGISKEAIHRISTFAGSTLDTMPYSGTVVMAHAFAGVKIKDGYPGVFMLSVVATTFSTSVVALLCALFPGLAV